MIDTKKIKNKHGFTLVEIIVVLVILAILAAVAIPSVLGYVDEAKKAGIIQEAHGIYEAAQIAEERNLMTGTRYFNVTGMLPFEEEVRDYIKIRIIMFYMKLFLYKKKMN